MHLLLVVLLAFPQGVPPPPPIPTADPRIAEERRKIVSDLSIPEARIFVAARTARGQELVFRYIELRGDVRRQFLAVLDERGSYYDTPGVIGCVGDPYRITLLWREGKSESWFSPQCQRIMPSPGSDKPFDAALSPAGAKRLDRLLAMVLRRGR